MRTISFRLAFCRIFVLALMLMSANFCVLQVNGHSGDNEKFGTEESSDPREVKVDEQGISSLLIKTVTVQPEFLKEVLKTTGDVQVDQTRAFNVTPPVSGVVKKVFAKQGDIVNPGEVLAIMHSVEVANNLTLLLNEKNKVNSEIERVKVQYAGEIQLAENQLNLDKSTVDREEALLKLGISARKNFLEAKSEYEMTLVKLSTLKQKFEQEKMLLARQLSITIASAKGQLKIMGIPEADVELAMTSGKVNQDLALKAPVRGYIITRDVTLGERVEPSATVFAIVNLTPIWVLVDIFQEQIPKVKEGQIVYLQTPSGERVTGTISSVGTVVEDITKTLHVRIIAQNPEGDLRPGMFITAEIVLGQSKRKAILVPESAIVYHKERPYVYEREKEEPDDHDKAADHDHDKATDQAQNHDEHKANQVHFVPQAVTLGNKSGGRVEVLTGLDPGDLVVVSGASQLLAQSILKPDAEHEHEGEKHEDHHGHEESETHQAGPEAKVLIGFGLGIGFAFIAAIILAVLTKLTKKPEDK